VELENGEMIGFVPEEHAIDVASFFDEGCKYRAFVTKVLTGGRVPIPVVQLDVFTPDANLPDLTPARAANDGAASVGMATRGAPRERSKLLPAILIVLVVLILIRAAVA
jgi:hypothetical protein